MQRMLILLLVALLCTTGPAWAQTWTVNPPLVPGLPATITGPDGTYTVRPPVVPGFPTRVEGPGGTWTITPPLVPGFPTKITGPGED